MEIRVFDNAAQAGQAAAALFAAQLTRKPNSVLGLATGSTPIPTYRQLIYLYEQGAVDFSQAVSYNLDEYVGLSPEHPCSYHAFMMEELFNHVNMRPEAIHVPSGNVGDLASSSRAYDAAIEAAGGIDIQLLGIGRNGHIGFNEPGDCFIDGCHLVTLSQSTIEANTRFFHSADEVPRQAVSLGIGAIMRARQVVLIATGADKAQAIHDSVLENVTPQVPCSILRYHPNTLFLLDREAASLL